MKLTEENIMFANKNDIIMNKFKKVAILEKNKRATIRGHFRRGTDP